MFKCKAALRLTRFAQTSPARRLTTSLCPEDFQRILPKSHLPAVPFPQKVYSNCPLRFLGCTNGKCYCLNRLKNVEVARLEGYRHRKAFRPRLLPFAAIYSLTSVLKSSENSPISTKILRGWRMARGAFGRELVKLKVPDTDVRADGALV